MPDIPNTIVTFAGFLKTKHAKAIINTIPEAFVLQRDAPFSQARKIGEQYQQAVITKLEQGGTYSASGGGAFPLNTAAAGLISKALVNSSQFVMKSQIDWETLAKAVSKSEIAHGSSADQLIRNMAMSSRKRLEVDMWMGQSTTGLGVIDTGGVSGATYTISEATWCPGYWVGMEGAPIDLFATGPGSQRDSGNVRYLESVDLVNRTVTMDTAHTGALATDVLFYDSQRAASSWNSMLGLLTLAGTTSGNLFGIAVTNSIWAPEQYAVSGSISFAILQDACVKAVIKGLNRGATAYVPIKAWADLLTEQAALRRYGGSLDGLTELVNGGKAIRFHSSMGELTIKPCIYIPDSQAVIVPTGSLVRVGATDVTFKVPGLDESLLQVSDTSAGVSLMCYYNQALFTGEPGQIVKLTGITYS